MQAVKLIKRKSPGYHKGRELQAYGAEFDTQGFVDGVESSIMSNLHDGVIVQDSVKLGSFTAGWSYASPIKYDTTSGRLSLTLSPPALTVWVDKSSADGSTLASQPDPPQGCQANPFVHCK
jgi:hypothetical protein